MKKVNGRTYHVCYATVMPQSGVGLDVKRALRCPWWHGCWSKGKGRSRAVVPKSHWFCSLRSLLCPSSTFLCSYPSPDAGSGLWQWPWKLSPRFPSFLYWPFQINTMIFKTQTKLYFPGFFSVQSKVSAWFPGSSTTCPQLAFNPDTPATAALNPFQMD